MSTSTPSTPFAERLQRDIDLSRSSNYGTTGRALYGIDAMRREDFIDALAFARQENLPWFVLGGGTNTLFEQERFEGVVIATESFQGRELSSDGRLVARAGTSLRTLIGASLAAGCAGLEGFIGIPGTIGGAVWGNAGGASGGIAPLVEAVRVLEPDGVVSTIRGEDLAWRYRESGLGDRVILEVALRLQPGEDREELRARALEVFERKKETQPLQAKSAGCVFRNPPGESAGRLIEAAGWKGRRLGGARVSDRHANFIVNDSGATAAEIARLMEEVRLAVADQFGIWLEREVIRAGERAGFDAVDSLGAADSTSAGDANGQESRDAADDR